MNINAHVSIPERFLERLLSAVESIAKSSEHLTKLVPPEVTMEFKPYGPEFWGDTTNQASVEVEETERLEAVGRGPSHWRDLEARAKGTPAIDSTPKV